MHGDEGQYFLFIQLYRLAWNQVIRSDDRRLIHLHCIGAVIGQHLKKPFGYILYIGCPSLHICIIHSLEHGCKVICRGANSIFGIHFLGGNDIYDRLYIVQVLQHHLMDLEYHGIGFAHVLHRLII